jgi:hypothetical protein
MELDCGGPSNWQSAYELPRRPIVLAQSPSGTFSRRVVVSQQFLHLGACVSFIPMDVSK